MKTMISQKCYQVFFISNGKKEKQSEIAERPRERESVLWQEEDSVGNKTDRYSENKTCDGNVRLISEIKNDNDVAPTICICSFVHL